MPSLPFFFAGVADHRGVVHITRNVLVGPFRIKIARFELRTQDGCNNRLHYLRVRANEDEIFSGEMHDCARLLIHSDFTWRGMLASTSWQTDSRPPSRLPATALWSFTLPSFEGEGPSCPKPSSLCPSPNRAAA